MGGSYLTILFRQLQILILFLSTSFCFLFCCCFVFSFWKIFLKVVAAAVFLALGFAFYVFFAPFVGEKMYQYIVIGLYSPLVTNLQIFLLSLFFFYNILICCFLSWSVGGVRSLISFFLLILFFALNRSFFSVSFHSLHFLFSSSSSSTLSSFSFYFEINYYNK